MLPISVRNKSRVIHNTIRHFSSQYDGKTKDDTSFLKLSRSGLPFYRFACIRGKFDPVKDYKFGGYHKSFKFPMTNDMQLDERGIRHFADLELKFRANTNNEYKRKSADYDMYYNEIPTKMRQRIARSKVKANRKRTLIYMMRKAIDTNPKYDSVQKRIIETKQLQKVKKRAAYEIYDALHKKRE